MDTLFENFTMSILRLNKLVQRIKLCEMEAFGLQAVHVMCVYCIGRCEGGITAGELVSRTLEDKAAISRALALLKRKGYVYSDGRKHNSKLFLTDEGKSIAEFIDVAAARAVDAGMDSALSDERRREFYATLNDIYENLKAYYQKLIGERSGKA